MPNDLRSSPLNIVQFALRVALLFLSVSVTALLAAIIYLDEMYPKLKMRPQTRRSLACFPVENETVVMYMGVIQKIDAILAVIMVLKCSVLVFSTSYPRVHWLISSIASVRFIVVCVEVIHASSFNDDTQLDWFVSVMKGNCPIRDDEIISYRVLVASLVFKFTEGFFTVVVSTFSYMCSFTILLFGLKDEPEASERRNQEGHELEELSNRRIHFTDP